MYFSTKELKSRNINLRPGEAFPFQDKHSIRLLGPAFGVNDAMNKPFSELDYVTSVDVKSPAMAEKIKNLKMSLRDAEKLASEAGKV